jgi:hypothetical protein
MISTMPARQAAVAAVQQACRGPMSYHTVPDMDAGCCTGVGVRQALCCTAGVHSGRRRVVVEGVALGGAGAAGFDFATTVHHHGVVHGRGCGPPQRPR